MFAFLRKKEKPKTTHRVNFEKCEAITSDGKHITFSHVSVMTERNTEAIDAPWNEALIIQMEVQATLLAVARFSTRDYIVENCTEFVKKVMYVLNSDTPFNSMGLRCTAINVGDICSD